MRETVSVAQAAIASDAVLPVRVQEVFCELVGAASEGLFALSCVSASARWPGAWKRQ